MKVEKEDREDLARMAREATRACRAVAETRGGWKWMGYVGAALITDKGSVFTGVNLSLFCGIGFCAEHSAIAEMVKNGETRIKRIVASTSNGKVIPPCGRCRELIYQIDRDNIDTEVVLGDEHVVRLAELLPENWQDFFDQPLD